LVVITLRVMRLSFTRRVMATQRSRPRGGS
jgi:hypothetical protein